MKCLLKFYNLELQDNIFICLKIIRNCVLEYSHLYRLLIRHYFQNYHSKLLLLQLWYCKFCIKRYRNHIQYNQELIKCKLLCLSIRIFMGILCIHLHQLYFLHILICNHHFLICIQDCKPYK